MKECLDTFLLNFILMDIFQLIPIDSVSWFGLLRTWNEKLNFRYWILSLFIYWIVIAIEWLGNLECFLNTNLPNPAQENPFSIHRKWANSNLVSLIRFLFLDPNDDETRKQYIYSTACFPLSQRIEHVCYIVEWKTFSFSFNMPFT